MLGFEEEVIRSPDPLLRFLWPRVSFWYFTYETVDIFHYYSSVSLLLENNLFLRIMVVISVTYDPL